QSSFTTTFHGQPGPVTTLIVLDVLPAAGTYTTSDGLTWKKPHEASCSMEKYLPPTRITSRRSPPVLGAMLNLMSRLPFPVLPSGKVTQLSPAMAFQAQPLVAVSLIVPTAPAAGAFRNAG